MDPGSLPRLNLRFSDPFPEPHLVITFIPPFPDVNLIFRAVAHARIRPYALAIEHGAICEETSLRIYAQAYAEGAIEGSETPGFESFSSDAWMHWLLEHPDHFQEIRELIDHRPNWDLPEEEVVDGFERHSLTG